MKARRSWFAAVAFMAAGPVGAVCVDWKATGRYADIEVSDIVFEGVAERIVEGGKACEPDRLIFKVTKVWKGPKRQEYSILQDSRRILHEALLDGSHRVFGCVFDPEEGVLPVGGPYIVFAVGPPDALRSLGCGSASFPNDRERRRLDEWKRRMKARPK